MNPTARASGIDRRALLSVLAVLPVLQPHTAIAQQRKPAAASAFSFAVYGDSRSMMYLPYKSSQREEAIKLMVDMFELVFPEKVAEAVVRRDVKLIYDPATDSFTVAAPLPQARCYHSATLLRNGKVLVAGGGPGSEISLPTGDYAYSAANRIDRNAG